MIGLMILAAAESALCAGPVDPYRIYGDVIANETTARAIAVAYIVSRFGQAELSRQLPLVVTAQGDAWKVAGTPPHRAGYISLGGIAEIVMCRGNGRVLRFTVSQ